MNTTLKFLAIAEVLVILYFVYSYTTASLGPGWAFTGVLTLVFIIAVICETGEKNVIK